MAKDRLFQLIRDEDVVLFVGAGFSLYAGYPSGKKLAEDIYSKLSKLEQQEIDCNKSLPELCDDIYYLKDQNKNFLLRCIKDAFSKRPKSKETHLQLSKIPLFKTIITTNYDTLIEDTHKDIEVIRNGKNLPLADNRKIHLFKIHGDLANLDEIILTQSDYRNYFAKDKDQTVFWNAVKNELTRHHILFIGYSLEDINVKTIIDKIYGELGEVKKEAYFVAPNLNEVKRRFLRSKGIVYINSTGEEFIRELSQDIKENYIPYVMGRGGSLDTISTFGGHNNIRFELSKNRDKVNINGFKPIGDGRQLAQHIQFTISQDVNEKIKKFKTSLESNELTFKQKDLLDFANYVNDIRINDKDGIKEFSLIRPPRYKGSVVLVFEDNYETPEINVVVHSVLTDDNKGMIKVSLLGFEVGFISDLSDRRNIKTEMNLEPKRYLRDVNEGIYLYNILDRFISGKRFEAFEKSKLVYSHEVNSKFDNKNEDYYDDPIEYFRDLKEVERFYSIRFTDIDLGKSNRKKLDRILAFIHKRAIPIESKGRSYKITDKEAIRNNIKEGKSYALKHSGSEENYITLHDHKLKIGYATEFFKEGIFINFQDVINGATDELKFIGENGTSYLCFSKNKDIRLSDFDFPKTQ